MGSTSAAGSANTAGSQLSQAGAARSAGTYVRLGAPALGPRGELGEIHRIIVDPQSNHVTDLVVRHGTVAAGETVVPLTMVRDVDEAGVHLALDQSGLEGLPVFAEPRYAVPDSPDVAAGQRSSDPGAIPAETGAVPSVAYGGQLAATDPAPLGNAITATAAIPAAQRPVVASGVAVFDVDGEKLGTVGALGVDPALGRVAHLALRQGLLLRHETALPVEWVDDITANGALLTVTKAQADSIGHDHRDG